ncbi:MAG: hypothetical protein PHQ46_07895 [Negativicutes bacterium]|nr:hypothetical protein [Negativicutes bacterium]
MIQENWHYRLCLMLAFQTLVAHSKKSEDLAEKTIELAKRMNEFCDLNISKAFLFSAINFADDKEAATIDEAIQRHIEELKTKEITHLPEDKETLLKLYDRLQQRKSRRMQWQFYATAKEDKLADLVLKLFDEELKETNAEMCQ